MLKITQLSFMYEKFHFDGMPSLGAITHFLESCLAHSMSTDLMKTDAQLSIEAMGGEVKCTVDTYSIFFDYKIPTDPSENLEKLERFMELAAEDLRKRIYHPEILNKDFECLIPYVKCKMSNYREIWYHWLLSKKIFNSKAPLDMLTYPDMSKAENIKKMKSLDFHEIATDFSTKMLKWKMVVLLQSDLQRGYLEDAFSKYFDPFVFKR